MSTEDDDFESAPETGPETEAPSLTDIIEDRMNTDDIDDDDGGDEEYAADDTQEASSAESDEPTEGDDGEPNDDEGDEEPHEDEDAYEPEEHWPAEVREALTAAPPQLAAVLGHHVKQLTDSYSQASRDNASLRQFAEPIAQLFPEERQQQLRQSGMSIPQAIGRLLQFRDFYESDPKEYFRWGLKTSGLTPQDLMPSDGEDEDLADPEIEALRQQVAAYEHNLQALQNNQTQQQQVTQNQRVMDTWQRFSAINDPETHEPAYPYAAQLQGPISQVLQTPKYAGQQITERVLHEAYWDALMSTPQYQDAMIEQQVNERVEKERQAQKATTARRQRTIRSPAPSATVESTPSSLSDIVSKNMGDMPNWN